MGAPDGEKRLVLLPPAREYYLTFKLGYQIHVGSFSSRQAHCSKTHAGAVDEDGERRWESPSNNE
jgi:hypothetical protein